MDARLLQGFVRHLPAVPRQAPPPVGRGADAAAATAVVSVRVEGAVAAGRDAVLPDAGGGAGRAAEGGQRARPQSLQHRPTRAQ